MLKRKDELYAKTRENPCAEVHGEHHCKSLNPASILAEWVAVLLQPAVGPLGALKNLGLF